MQSKQTLAEALRYADLGFSIFPILPRDKRPATKSGFKDASRDPAQLNKWWADSDFGIGIATGAASGVVVVDIDVDKLTDASRLIVEKLEREKTACVTTGTGGLHFYFQAPAVTLRNRAGILPGIDFRADGGYVVAPPSIHPNGKPYTWGMTTEPLAMPQWVVDFVKAPESARSDRPSVGLEKKGRLSKRTQNFMLNGAPNGSWNPSLFAAAKDHQEQGYTIEEFILRAEGITGHLDEKDLRSIKSAFTQAPKYDPRGVEDNSLHSQFLQSISETANVIYWGGELYEWVYTHYRVMDFNHMEAVVRGFLKGKVPKVTSTVVKEFIADLQALRPLPEYVTPPVWLAKQSDKNTISLKNGILCLDGLFRGEDVKLVDHSPDYFTLTHLPYEYDATASCPTFLELIEYAIPDAETRDALQEWFGCHFSDRMNYERFMIFEGNGANGKSVVCTIMEAMLGGDGNVSHVGLENFRMDRTFPLYAMVGKLANIVEELNESSKTQEGVIKSIVTGSGMTIERKNVDAFNFRPRLRLTFATNVLPHFVDKSSGIWRRLLLIRFEQTVPEDKRNPDFLNPEFWAPEMPGILNWAIEGLKRSKLRGRILESKKMREWAARFETDMNPHREFIEGNYVVSSAAPPVAIPKADVYSAYREWMQENGYDSALGPVNFNREIRRAFPAVEEVMTRKSDGVAAKAWQGIEAKKAAPVLKLKALED